MPTPFTHLIAAQRLLDDEHIPANLRGFLRQECSAFLLGNIAADARISSGLKRADTHFYRYDEPMDDHAWRTMLARFPSLGQPYSDAQRAFVAGYVAHLSIDETWTVDMLRPHFVEREWRTGDFRFFMLHILLILMDERDYRQLAEWQAGTLAQIQPDGWLPFIADADLAAWGAFIRQQIAGESQTLQVFGERIKKTPAEFREVLDSPERLQADLWRYISQPVIENVEAKMYAFARQQMLIYLDESDS